jgi:protein SCO1/2
VKLGDYFGRKPVVLTFVYYECPMLCTQVLNGLESALRVINESIGKEFDVVTVSFDPKETPVLARARRRRISNATSGRARAGLALPDRRQASIDALTKAAGFNFRGTRPRTSSRTPAASW